MNAMAPLTAVETAARIANAPVKHLIDGECQSSVGTIEVVDPSTGEICAVCPDASRQQLDQAVAAARRAQPGWEAMPIGQRRAALGQLVTMLRAGAKWRWSTD
jgi:acyl-CoA reductase-like NAD-dependent aldehyde dehydrogenase